MASEVSRRRAVVLVCDHDLIFRRAVVSHLRGAGYATLEVGDGQACIESVREHAPDCVLLDVVMPRMSGISALRALREEGNEVPVIFVTATGGIDSAIAATQLGASAYLQPPLDVLEIVTVVDRVLATDRLKREGTTGRSTSP